MKLPLDAVISPKKLTEYLLVKRPIGDKSEFLKKAGYGIDNWRQLLQDIRTQVLPHDAVFIEETEYGEYFEIPASLVGPNGIKLKVRTVWMRESESGLTKFITLYPDKRKSP